jgi:aspartate/methionine/tyrosine aminotransferase
MSYSDKRIANRMQHIQPFHVMELLARARQLEAEGRSIIHMEIGEPDFATPVPVINAGSRALESGYIHYTPATGLPALREAISEHYQRRYQADVPASRILVTPGASGALQLAFAVSFNPGDKVLMADPSYPCYRNFCYFFDTEPIGIPVDHHSSYQLTAEIIEQNWDDAVRGVLLASPSNPTGTVVDNDELARIIELVHERDGTLIVDEIYHGLVYDADITTALSFSDKVFVMNSFSKYYGMTGWRVGWLVAPADAVRECDKLAQNIFLAASTLAQHAALEALTEVSLAILESRRQEFQKRRDYLLPALRDLGFDIPVTPRGAFYLYADCSRFTDDSYMFSRDLLEQAGVAITPGLDFGHNRPEQFVRFAYTNDIENLLEGVERIRKFIC